jgi:tRNA-dihydrouridine synthase
MSCQSNSNQHGNNATAPSPAIAPGAEVIDVAAYARMLGSRPEGPIDPRVPALVPGFDAPFFQAGLCGYSDAPMRLVARKHGCPMCVTEALLDRTLLAGGRGFAKADLGDVEDNVPGGELDHPLTGQIMGSEPREMAAAAIKMIEQGRRNEKAYRTLAYAVDGVLPSTHVSAGQHLRLPGGQQVGFYNPLEGLKPGAAAGSVTGAMPDEGKTFEVIDVNLACPVKKIDKKARGGHWLTEPDGAIEILEAVREAVPAEIPCTVKLRRSYDDSPQMIENFHRIFDAVYEMGYAWTTVHARTVEQRYVGPSRWAFLKALREMHPERMFFGSGDIWNAADIFRMLAYTGVTGVSVARGCIGNPWIFRQARDMLAGLPPRAPTIAEQREVLLEHFTLALAAGKRMKHSEEATALTMRKFGIRFAEHHPDGEKVRREFIGVKGMEDWSGVLERWYED